MFILIFRDFNPEIHDVYKVAELIYDVDYRTFKHVFKSKEEGVEAIKNRLLLIDFAKDAEADENDLWKRKLLECSMVGKEFSILFSEI